MFPAKIVSENHFYYGNPGYHNRAEISYNLQLLLKAILIKMKCY